MALSRKGRSNQLRRKILQYLFECYEEDALCPVSFLHLVEGISEDKDEVVPHLRYLENAGFLKVSWNLAGTGIIRMRTEGVDAAEDDALLDKIFPLDVSGEPIPLTHGGDQIMQQLEYDETLTLRKRVELMDLAREVYGEIRIAQEAGVDFAKVWFMFARLLDEVPHLRRELEDSLRPDLEERHDTWNRREIPS